MGYELHITRKEHWVDEDPALNISLKEWTELVNNDPEMRMDHAATATTSDDTITAYAEGLSVWTAYSRDGIMGNHAWFAYHGGNICVKNPDAEMIHKMQSIATLLDAKVMGDDGELYIREDKPAASREKSWWKFW
ncbi:hypothetical protein LL912_19090 [Niabella sp. CC-SYL272]|uniref:hypothetical protein n=1 Tax=Niabella agricola TaxID=2891571 RepID=UPI001F34F45B|nr:hypothetical protein [Niabella agricola]MCF3110899.1 hypothetical protein [Niabella agricola]